MTIFEILKLAKINNLDASLIVSHVLNTTRAYLITHSDRKLTAKQISEIKKLYKKRYQHYPLAYLVHNKEFYGRKFYVNHYVLIPRPETEAIIESALKLKNIKNVLDIGTGSGNIAITLKLENPQLKITASDISKRALKVAQKNAQKYLANIKFVQSNLFQKVRGKYDLIIANLPYVNKKWEWNSKELKYEPKKALYADDNGLELIKKLLLNSSKHLNKNAYLFIEADTSQLDAIAKIATERAFKEVSRTNFSLLFQYTV